MLKNIDLFEDGGTWKKPKATASVKTVLKPRNPEDESADFFKAQSDMAKEGLPAAALAVENPITINVGGLIEKALKSDSVIENDSIKVKL